MKEGATLLVKAGAMMLVLGCKLATYYICTAGRQDLRGEPLSQTGVEARLEFRGVGSDLSTASESERECLHKAGLELIKSSPLHGTRKQKADVWVGLDCVLVRYQSLHHTPHIHMRKWQHHSDPRFVYNPSSSVQDYKHT